MSIHRQSLISIHKALAGLDHIPGYLINPPVLISIHKALAGLDTLERRIRKTKRISIHKALAGLDDL